MINAKAFVREPFCLGEECCTNSQMLKTAFWSLLKTPPAPPPLCVLFQHWFTNKIQGYGFFFFNGEVKILGLSFLHFQHRTAFFYAV